MFAATRLYGFRENSYCDLAAKGEIEELFGKIWRSKSSMRRRYTALFLVFGLKLVKVYKAPNKKNG